MEGMLNLKISTPEMEHVTWIIHSKNYVKKVLSTWNYFKILTKLLRIIKKSELKKILVFLKSFIFKHERERPKELF